MKDTRIAKDGLVLLGCGKMGSAMLAGWLARGLPTSSVYVIDPKPSDWLKEQGVQLNVDLPKEPAVVLVAVKPQMMGDALPTLQAMGNGKTVFVSVAAGSYTLVVAQPAASTQTYDADGTGTPNSSALTVGVGEVNILQDFGYRWVTRFIALDKTDATKALTRIRRQWFNKRKSITALLREVMYNQPVQLLGQFLGKGSRQF